MLLIVMMIGDEQLMRQYAGERSEPAFAELVRRHLKMVYAAALRQVNGDTYMAEDVAQSVFTDLARKAGKLQHHGSIAGWLCASTRFAAANAVRGETRRRTREQEVVAMNEINAKEPGGWNELRPMIDEALNELGEADREAIVLRYFESYEFALVGAALGVSENAARMRVDRALDKLRAVLQKRGVAASAAALAGALAESSATAVPVQLAAGITSAALAQTAATSAGSSVSIPRINCDEEIYHGRGRRACPFHSHVLIVRNLPNSDAQTGAATPSKAEPRPPVQRGGPASSSFTAGEPDLLKKIVRRHDEQARAKQAQDAANDRGRRRKVGRFRRLDEGRAWCQEIPGDPRLSLPCPGPHGCHGGLDTPCGNASPRLYHPNHD